MLRHRSFKIILGVMWLVVMLVTACSSADDGQVGAADNAEGDSGSADAYKLTQQFSLSIVVTSTKFNETRRIPKLYSCEQEDISPPISWGDVPDGTVSLALVMDSDQAAGSPWTHWVIWGLPPAARGLAEAVPNTPAVPSIGPRAAQGTNSHDKIGWSGPCKEKLRFQQGSKKGQSLSRDRITSDYFFRLYALDTAITLGSDATKADLLRAIEGHILAGGELLGQQTGVTCKRAVYGPKC